MNIAFALDYIPRRMNELGYGENYITRYRQISLDTKFPTVINAYNQLLLFIDPVDGIQVKSKRGVLNYSDTTVTEQQHEHSGKVVVSTATYGKPPIVVFIQVIPLNPKKKLK